MTATETRVYFALLTALILVLGLTVGSHINGLQNAILEVVKTAKTECR